MKLELLDILNLCVEPNFTNARFAAPLKLWNDNSPDIRNASSINIFKSKFYDNLLSKSLLIYG